MNTLDRRSILTGTLALALGAGCKKTSGTSDVPIGPLMPTAELAKRLEDVKSGKIHVIYVGPEVLFEKHKIPGAQLLGPVESQAGQTALNRRLAESADAELVVLYCGCCPVRNCPNVRPASRVIAESGRKNVRVLDLPTRFSTDWADKGYPVDKG